MTDWVLLAVGDWSVRATLLAAVTGALLWVSRVENVHVRLFVWTAVLIGLALMPVAMFVMQPIPLWIGVADAPGAVFDHANVLAEVEFAAPVDPVVPDRIKWGYADVAVGVWLLVALGMLGRVAVGLRLAGRLRKGSRPLANGAFESDSVRVPVAVGLLRPIVILPADWHDWDTAKLRAVLAHEFAHVTRRDPLRQVAASVFRAVVWFHPLAWWLRSHLAELSELASDDVAVSALGDRVFYAETLLEFIERAQGRVRLEGVAMASPRTRARRLARLLDENHCPSRVPVAPVGWVITAVLLALMCVAAVVRPQRLQAQSLVLTPPAVAAAPQVALPGAEAKPTAVLCGGVGAYRKWLDEDAVYIVTRDERREYLALQTERDCQTFISQFWQRRPAGMKIEHYRRIAYANERLAASAPGWRTDRGRTYIVYGPPDEIESHLTAGRTYPFEVWRYRSIDGLGEDVRFEFVDSKQNGEYPLLAVRDAAAMALLRMPPGSGPAQAVPRVAMLLLSPRVDVDGTDFGSAGVPALSGHEVYVATRGAGAFILSLEPGAGLTQIGTATGRRIEVEVGGHAMRIDCSADVSPTGTAPVYGRFDRSYRPTKDLEVGSGTPR